MDLSRGTAVLFLLGLALPLGQTPAKEPPKHFTNSIGMKFVWIPPGSFQMGSPKQEVGRNQDETLHKVTLTKGFYLGVYAVTQAQWRALMGNNPSLHKGDGRLPVENVSWDDCQKFLKRMGQKDGRVYRLPTQAEWEYACRAGSHTAYYFGNDPKALGQYAWYGEREDERGGIHPVGEKKPNAWGLYDMHGNVWQWCADWVEVWGDGSAKRQPSAKPAIDPQGPVSGELRAMRGGSYLDDASELRCANRSSYVPSGYSYLGFRAAGSLGSEEKE